MATYWKIGSTNMPNPANSGVVISDEPIWTSSTGRDTTGTMQGSIVAWKTTIDITLPALTFSQANTVRKAIKNAGSYFNISIGDAGDDVTFTVYTSNIPRTIYSNANGLKYVIDMKLQFVER